METGLRVFLFGIALWLKCLGKMNNLFGKCRCEHQLCFLISPDGQCAQWMTSFALFESQVGFFVNLAVAFEREGRNDRSLN